MRFRKTALAGVLCTLSAAAGADCSATGCYNVYVDQLQMTSTNGAWVQTSGNETLANCTPDAGVLLHIPASNVQLKELYATLLAAQLSDKLVSIVINTGTSPCTISYVTLARQ